MLSVSYNERLYVSIMCTIAGNLDQDVAHDSIAFPVLYITVYRSVVGVLLR